MHRTDGGRRRLRTTGIAVAALTMIAGGLAPQLATAQDAPSRQGLAPGIFDAESAMTPNLEHLSTTPRTEQAQDRTNSDMAFTDGHVIVGNYGGFNVYDVADPTRPRLVSAVSCPGGQADVSVDGDLLFVSVEQASGFVNCLTGEDGDVPFRGVRVFDVSNLARPQQVAAVQTCRGSHTHTLVPDLDGEAAYVYVSGTAAPRTDDIGDELGCVTAAPGEEPVEDDARWRIEIIEVPYDAPQDAAIIAGPRLFAEGDRIDGLQQQPPTEFHPSGPDHRTGGEWSPAPVTDACHDITAYPEIGLAAGACEGNGLLIDITDPAAPVRVAAVADDNFAYWHSATFGNDGDTVLFTDEWGGGGQAYCTEEERPEWGANGIYEIVRDGDEISMEFASYFKIPGEQEDNEICVAHNGNLIPVPGRDIMVQAWYQGGLSIWEFTDPANPVELGWFDRGPIQTDTDGPVQRGGFWSVYWYDGLIYGTDIARGLDVFELSGDDVLTQPEVDAAAAVTQDQSNPQLQERYEAEVQPAGPVCDRVEPVGFDDVGGPPHADNIGCIAGYGIARGVAGGGFAPGSEVQRGQMASFLAGLLTAAGVELPAGDGEPFDDVAGTTHAQAIGQLAELEVVAGTGDGSFTPAATVSRGQMASFLVNALELVLDEELSAPASPFTDSASSVHAGSIDVVADRDIAAGTSGTTFEPGADVTRAQMASFLVATLAALDAEGVAVAPLPG